MKNKESNGYNIIYKAENIENGKVYIGATTKSIEERKIIMPAIDKLKKHRININGPYPSDTIFSNKKKYKYDVIVGMYHDQVLAPFKAMYEYNAINITLGLKYIRVSPDHGVAKDMIFKNKANPASLIEAIKFFSKLP